MAVPRTKTIVAVGSLAALAVTAIVVPLPTPIELRQWATGIGAGAPVVVLLAYSLLTVAPVPRTVFTLAAGLLLGNTLGLIVAMTATTVSATLGFALAKALGADVVQRHLYRAPIRIVNERLTNGGILAVTSLRLIPVVPFAPLSYCCGVSSIALRPYVLGTVIGSLPGTAATVILGDALTGTTSPALFACYAGLALLGGIGLIIIVRKKAPEAAYSAAPVA